jgi:F-type H+-transporting ATPase subunit gamma
MELYQILLEAKASEHSARMVAMKNATENALDLVDDLNLTYNGIRQEVITKEILDISTAAVALE